MRSADEVLAKRVTFQGFDVVLSDLVMSGERIGLDLARTVRALALSPGTPRNRLRRRGRWRPTGGLHPPDPALQAGYPATACRGAKLLGGKESVECHVLPGSWGDGVAPARQSGA